MARDRYDLFKSYRELVKWGMYEEAAQLHREMIGGRSDDPAPDLRVDLAVMESEPRQSFAQTLRRLFRKARPA